MTKIRIFWVRVPFSPLKLTLFQQILASCIEWIAKSMFKKNQAHMLIYIPKNWPNSQRQQKFELFFPRQFKPLRIHNFRKTSLDELLDYFVIFISQKKSGRYVDFEVQYWRKRRGRRIGKFSLFPSLNFKFPARA